MYFFRKDSVNGGSKHSLRSKKKKKLFKKIILNRVTKMGLD